MPMTALAPVVSLAGFDDGTGPEADRVAAAIDRACTDVGFFGVVDHGIAEELPAAALDVARRFFALPVDIKRRWVVATPPGVQRGYCGLGGEAQAAAVGDETPPDLSETYSVGPVRRPSAEPWSMDDTWPDEAVPEFRAAFGAWRAAADALGRSVLRACALAVTGRAGAFDHMVTRPLGGLRANHYPRLDAVPAAGQWRGGAHTDYGTLTVLATDGTAGLEIEAEPGAWRPVEAPAGGFLINIGDTLALQTRGRWRSTWHRVRVPDSAPPHPARTSLAFFQFPNPECAIDGLGVPTAGEYLRMKVASIAAAGTASNSTSDSSTRASGR
jgi:isopenicillin N synthase-like dioxygenase